MVAFGPARTLEADGLERQQRDRDKQNQQPPAEKSKHRNIATHRDRITYRRMLTVGLGLDAQIVVSRGNAGHDHFIPAAAFGPRAVTVGAGIIADLTPEVPRTASVLVD